METKPTFIMLIGLPGAGKTTYAIDMYPNFVILSSDTIIDTMANIVNKKYSDIYKHISGSAVAITEHQLKLASYAKENIVLDQCNLNPRARARKLNLLNNRDKYHKIAIYFDIPENILNLRLHKREQSGKIIPKSVMDNMRSSIKPPTLHEGFDQVRIIQP